MFSDAPTQRCRPRGYSRRVNVLLNPRLIPMATLTVYLNRNAAVLTATVTVVDSNGRKTTLTIHNFKSCPAGGSHVGDSFADVTPFADKPSFDTQLDITASGGGRALVTFAIDGTDLPTSECLKADWQHTHDQETVP